MLAEKYGSPKRLSTALEATLERYSATASLTLIS